MRDRISKINVDPNMRLSRLLCKETVRTKLHGSVMAGDAAYDLFTGNTAYLASDLDGLYEPGGA